MRTFHLRKDDRECDYRIECYVDGELAGHVMITGEDRYELVSPMGAPGLILDRLEVKPKFWRQGIGGALLEKAIKRFLRVFWDEYDLFVRAQPLDNCMSLNALVKIYASYGFFETYRSADNTSATMWWQMFDEMQEGRE